MKTSTLTSRVIGAIDRLLDIAARFLEHLAHFAGHVPCVLIFVFAEDLAEVEQQLGTLRCRSPSPLRRRVLCRLNGSVYVVRIRCRKTPNDIRRVGRVYILEPLGRRAFHPLTADVIVICLRRGLLDLCLFCFCHKLVPSPWSQESHVTVPKRMRGSLSG